MLWAVCKEVDCWYHLPHWAQWVIPDLLPAQMKRVSGFFCFFFFFPKQNTGTKKEKVHFCVRGTDQKRLQAAPSPSAHRWSGSAESKPSTGHQTVHVGAVGLMPQTPATSLTLYDLCLGAKAVSWSRFNPSAVTALPNLTCYCNYCS